MLQGYPAAKGMWQTNILTSAIYPAYIANKDKNYFWAALKRHLKWVWDKPRCRIFKVAIIKSEIWI